METSSCFYDVLNRFEKILRKGTYRKPRSTDVRKLWYSLINALLNAEMCLGTVLFPCTKHVLSPQQCIWFYLMNVRKSLETTSYHIWKRNSFINYRIYTEIECDYFLTVRNDRCRLSYAPHVIIRTREQENVRIV